MKTNNAIFISIILFFCCSASHAQLKVLSNGKVGIGTTTPKYSLLDIGKAGTAGGLTIYNSALSNPLLFKLYSNGDYGYLNFGGVAKHGITICKDGGIGLGADPSIELETPEYINIYTYGERAALMAYAKYPYDYGDIIKVYSWRDTDMAYVVRDVRNGGSPLVFYVAGDGSVYSKGSILTASDESYKENISSINNSLNTIRQMRGVTYKLKEQADESTTASTLQSDVSSRDTLSAQSPVPVEIVNKIKAEKKRKKSGFIAQELEEIFPEAVYTLPNGKKAIAYSEIIPLLVEAIKEQQNEIDKQQNEIDELRQSKIVQTRSAIGAVDEQSDVNSLLDEKLKAKLYSNIPNPFKEQTTISFFIPETSSRASIHIYNLQGKQIKQLNIESRGNGSVTINGYELTPGMYMYSLIVDGQEVDTKKMILTE
ncbi:MULTISPECIES: tail fiber domain-containing protein [Bacteroides]|nr:tail fiber domain-containing protein [Bacteroides nordii]MCE8467027.1 tail fiber domain-containing protein [Bacteroides nordii]UYU47905.1 tail fiber domain-containing protein [Bacteroides nordii]